MIEFLREWVLNIVVLVIFITFLDIILPSSKMKRYINMITGLLIIIVLMNPFIELIASEMDLEREVFSNMITPSGRGDYDKKDIVELQNQQVIEIYKNSLKKEILDLLGNKVEYTISNIDLEINEKQDHEDFGKIKKVDLVISDKGEEKDAIEVNVKVDEVEEVGVNLDNESEVATNNNLDQYKDIRKVISDSYRIPEENVFISRN